MCGLRRPFSSAPKVSTYCDQLVINVGVLAGPAGAKPTNAAIAVPTPSMGRVPLATSLMYTPGVRYSGIRDSGKGQTRRGNQGTQSKASWGWVGVNRSPPYG